MAANDKGNSSSDCCGSKDSKNMESSESVENAEEILPGFKTFDAFRQAAFKSLMEATRNSNSLPNGQSWDYYTSFPSFKKIMDGEGRRVLELISMLFRHQGMKGSIVRRDFEEKFDLIVDANDTILERVGCNLDEMAGIRRNPEPVLVEAVGNCTRPVSGSWNVDRSAAITQQDTTKPLPIRLLTAKFIQRPQIKFKDKIDNSMAPFEPRIKDKPNSLKPLAIMPEINDNGDESFSHPYEYELERFKPSPAQLKRGTPQMYKPVEDTPLIYIDQEEQLPSLVQDLAKYSEIAVDLEHHSYRSFQGFTCLMQISTRDTDYIIDTLELRDKLHVLNEVFTKPSIIKVFHGADSDVEWLQRDLCLYVVNMFDTHQASKLLYFNQLSLAFLMKHYCGVQADKHFQLADWRIRPLPQELIMYARQDTHYLLYIYDKMQNALLDASNGQDNLLKTVFQLSTEVCKKRYVKPVLREDSHMLLYRRNKKMFDNRQLYCLKELFRWRDKMARQEDESISYILPNHMMIQIAETLPREMQGILACCNPIPPLVRQNLLALHYIVLQAREQSLVKPILQDSPHVRVTTQSWIKLNLEGPLHCPHDLTHMRDFRDDLPTLLGGSKALQKPNYKLKAKPTVSVFENEDEENVCDPLEMVTFVCPYERYKKVKPFIQSQEAEKVEESAEQQADDNDDDERVQRIKQHYLEVTSQLEQKKQRPPEETGQNVVTIKEARTTDDIRPLRDSKRKRKGKRERKESRVEGETQAEKRAKMEGGETNAAPKKGKKKQPEEGFQPFNYSSVDFSQFQGGSRSNQGNNKVDAKFKSKGKNRRKSGKKNQKSMTFGKGW